MQKLYYGNNIITMKEASDQTEAILVEDGKIKQVGMFDEFKEQMNEPEIEKIDLEDTTIMPGFIDPHGHIAMTGALTETANLRDCESFDDIVETLNQYVEDKGLKDTDVVVGFGYDHNFLKELEHPTKEVLNQVSKSMPIFISHASGHVGCANDAALEMAGIDETTPDAQGGFIGRVEGTNEPNGYLEENSMMELNLQIASKTKVDHSKLTLLGQELYIQNGITTAQDGATSSDMLQLFSSLAENGLLKIDIVTYPTIADNPEDMWEYASLTKQYENRLKIGGYKLFLDGSPQGKTAWMTEPYEGEESYRGYAWSTDNEVKDYVLKALNTNAQLLTHCNGDAASDQLLNSYEQALAESTNPNKANLRPVMIHCQTVRDDQLDKMVDLQMIPSIFNAHTYYWGDVHLKNLGEARGNKISPAKTAFDKGLVVNFHQDSPVVEPNMLHSIWAGVNRITRKGVKIGEEECVSVYQALQAVTINAAYAYFEENEKGSIEVGKVADFVILDKNPLEVDQMEIKDIQVLETIKEGETIFKRETTLNA